MRFIDDIKKKSAKLLKLKQKIIRRKFVERFKEDKFL